MTEAVVLRAPLRIGQNLVGLVEFLEALLGLFVARIAIRMKLDRERAVRLLQLRLAGAAINAENLVVVAFVSWRHRAKILVEHPGGRQLMPQSAQGGHGGPPHTDSPIDP